MASRFGFGSTDGLVITLDTDPIQQYRHITWKPRDIVKFYRKSAVPSFGGVFYDIDGDGNDEFCVCSLSGDLAVYKMDSNCDWNCCIADHGVLKGNIICIVGGDIENNGGHLLIAVSVEGNAYFFELNHDAAQERVKSPLSFASNSYPNGELLLKYSCTIPYNVSVAMISKIEDNYQLIIGSNSREVHSLLFNGRNFQVTHSWKLKEQVVSLCEEMEKESAFNAASPVIVAGLDSGIFARISLHSGLTGVSYSGANYDKKKALDSENLANEDEDNDDYHPLRGSMLTDNYLLRIQSRHSSVTFVGSLSNPDGENYIVCGSYDGILSLQNDERIIWDIQLNHPIVAVHAIHSDDTDIIIAACSSGMIFVCDKERNVVGYRGTNNTIISFTTGKINVNGQPISIFALLDNTEDIKIFPQLSMKLYSQPLLSYLKPIFSNNKISQDWNKQERISFIKSCIRVPWCDKKADKYLEMKKKELEQLKKEYTES